MFYIDFTAGDTVMIIAEANIYDEAMTTAKAKQSELKANGQRGIITVYEGSGEVHKTYDFIEV